MDGPVAVLGRPAMLNGQHLLQRQTPHAAGLSAAIVKGDLLRLDSLLCHAAQGSGCASVAQELARCCAAFSPQQQQQLMQAYLHKAAQGNVGAACLLGLLMAFGCQVCM